MQLFQIYLELNEHEHANQGGLVEKFQVQSRFVNEILFQLELKMFYFLTSIIKTNILNTDYAKDFKVNKLKGNCKKINDMIDAVKNKKVLFLTGTPCAKTPFELVPLFNLTSKHKLFVEDYELFNKQYLDFTNMKILHKDQLLNTLDGLIAYVPPITNNDKNNKEFVIVNNTCAITH